MAIKEAVSLRRIDIGTPLGFELKATPRVFADAKDRRRAAAAVSVK
jgi:hypothetical protein